MRYVLILLLAVHGVAYLVGFAVPWRLALALGWAAVAVGVARRSSWWIVTLEVLAVVSLALCVLSWPEARLGVAANLLILAAAFATIRFSDGLAVRDAALDSLWGTAHTGTGRVFKTSDHAGLPDAALTFLQHAIAEGTPLPSAVKLRMRGEIKLGAWRPFRAEQVISQDGEFVWAAAVCVYGMPILGSDRMVDGGAAMQWRLFDLVPVATASGPDVNRSAVGRFHGEHALWLPSSLLSGNPTWSEAGPGKLRIRLGDPTQPVKLNLKLDTQRRATSVQFNRWGDPDGQGYREEVFGVVLEEERTFGGFTIPSRIRAGWFFGSERFDSEGEFFRAVIDQAEFR